MAEQTEDMAATDADAASSRRITWVRREDVPPFSPVPGIQLQPVIGEKMMTCWIEMAPNAVVAEHSHVNEQLGVVAAGAVTLTAAGESRTVELGDAYVVPSHLPHSAVAGPEGALLVETFVPVREDYAQAWRAVAGR